uniref:SGNH hydrolase-type esterase domain-containing protein n=1 Tax=Mola mola TaxID=94237 RepID=A0A3Q3XAP4_MOLML
MPRTKGYKRSIAAKKRESERRIRLLPPQQPSNYSRCGTGYRHMANKWPISPFTGRSHKLAIPADAPDKKFVLVIGDSHLRSVVDGIVRMPEGPLSFGLMSTPGAHAMELRKEVVHAIVPWPPDAVVVVAPSNNLTASRTIAEAAADFAMFLGTVCSRWPNVCVLDFPPRLDIEGAYQDFMRQEFHRVAVRMGVRYFSTAEHFPLEHLDLWCTDNVHLSDTEGMPILAKLLWGAAYQQLEGATPKPHGCPRAPPLPPPPPRFIPQVPMKGEVTVSRQPNPSEWQVVAPDLKKCRIMLHYDGK